MITIFNLFNWSFNLETYIERCVCRYIIRRVGENLPIKSYPTFIIHHLLPYLLSYINQCLSSIKDILHYRISFFLKSSVFFSNNYLSIVCVCVCVCEARPPIVASYPTKPHAINAINVGVLLYYYFTFHFSTW